LFVTLCNKIKPNVTVCNKIQQNLLFGPKTGEKFVFGFKILRIYETTLREEQRKKGELPNEKNRICGSLIDCLDRIIRCIR